MSERNVFGGGGLVFFIYFAVDLTKGQRCSLDWKPGSPVLLRKLQ